MIIIIFLAVISTRHAVSMVMGASIGCSSVVTVLTSLVFIKARAQLRKAFRVAVLYDLINILSLILNLPLEIATGVFHRLVKIAPNLRNRKLNDVNIIEGFWIKKATKPLTDVIIQLAEDNLLKVAVGNKSLETTSPIKFACSEAAKKIIHLSSCDNCTIPRNASCNFLFHKKDLKDKEIACILLIGSLIILCVCTVAFVKMLPLLLKGRFLPFFRRHNSSHSLTGYIFMILGIITAFSLQSAVILALPITVLSGIGMVSIYHAIPFILGSDIGFSSLAVIYALPKSETASEIAFCSLLQSFCSALLWYILPFTRKLPIIIAQCLGNIAANLACFPVLYLLMSLVWLACCLGLSLVGCEYSVALACVIYPVLLIAVHFQLKTKFTCCSIEWSWQRLNSESKFEVNSDRVNENAVYSLCHSAPIDIKSNCPRGIIKVVGAPGGSLTTEHL